MFEQSDFIPYLVVFMVTMAVVVRQTWSGHGAGLMLAYCFQMFMLYWVGALMHTLPWSELPSSELAFMGFQQATYGMVAFAVGALALGGTMASQLARRQVHAVVPDTRLPRMYILFGMCFFFVLAPTLGRVSGFSAVASVGSQLVVVGCCLNCWKEWSRGGQRALIKALVPTLMLPCVTVVVQGFLGFGVMALSTIMVFCAQFFRPRWVLVVGFVASSYFGISVYTTYMKGRGEIRNAVWARRSLLNRVTAFVDVAGSFEFFSPANQEHMDAIDNRLNQDTLVGSAVQNLSITGDYARGDTLKDALIGMIPRVIWPDKPVTAGSGGLVTRFTGIDFAEGTSVGIGPVMELYANFGTAAVVIGFFLLGAVIRVLDSMAGSHLAVGNWRGFAAYCLVGISFLNVSGSFVEVTMGALASLVLALFVNKILNRMKGKLEEPVLDEDAQWIGA